MIMIDTETIWRVKLRESEYEYDEDSSSDWFFRSRDVALRYFEDLAKDWEDSGFQICSHVIDDESGSITKVFEIPGGPSIGYVSLEPEELN